MKILMISSFLPYPLYSGGHIRLYNLIKELSKKNSITLICEKRDNQSEKEISKVKEICDKVLTVPRFKQWSFKNIIKTAFSLNPFLITGHTNKLLSKAIKNELKNGKYNLIHIETSYIFQNLPKTILPTVLVEHNIEHLVYKRFSDRANFFLKPFLYWDVYKLKTKEQRFWKKAKKLIAVSDIEKSLMGVKDVEVIPNGVDIEKFKFNKKDPLNKDKKILFIGDFKWIQNTDALKFILFDIWPKVLQKIDSVQLLVVGKNIPEAFRNQDFKNVIFDHSNNEETEEIFKKTDILLAPIRIGGGTSFKVLEAMASGVGVVTTELGVEGIGAKNKIHVLTASDSHEFSKCLIDLLSNKDLFEKLTSNARELIEDKYDWKKIAQRLEYIYKALI